MLFSNCRSSWPHMDIHLMCPWTVLPTTQFPRLVQMALGKCVAPAHPWHFRYKHWRKIRHKKQQTINGKMSPRRSQSRLWLCGTFRGREHNNWWLCWSHRVSILRPIRVCGCLCLPERRRRTWCCLAAQTWRKTIAIIVWCCPVWRYACLCFVLALVTVARRV